METLTFEKLPEAVSKLQEKLNDIEQLLLEAIKYPAETDELLTIS